MQVYYVSLSTYTCVLVHTCEYCSHLGLEYHNDDYRCIDLVFMSCLLWVIKSRFRIIFFQHFVTNKIEILMSFLVQTYAKILRGFYAEVDSN